MLARRWVLTIGMSLSVYPVILPHALIDTGSIPVLRLASLPAIKVVSVESVLVDSPLAKLLSLRPGVSLVIRVLLSLFAVLPRAEAGRVVTAVVDARPRRTLTERALVIRLADKMAIVVHLRVAHVMAVTRVVSPMFKMAF